MEEGLFAKGDVRTQALADIFAIASRNFGEISSLLSQLHAGAVPQSTVLGKRVTRPATPKKKQNFWTNQELDLMEGVLRKHIENGGTSENVVLDELVSAIKSRSRNDIEKELTIYQRATTDNFRDLPFMKRGATVKDEPSSQKAKESNTTKGDSKKAVKNEKSDSSKKESSKKKEPSGDKKSRTTSPARKKAKTSH